MLLASHVLFQVSVYRPFSGTRPWLTPLRELLLWEENVVRMCSYLRFALEFWGLSLFFFRFQGKAWVHLSKNTTHYSRGILLGFKVYLSRSNTYQDLFCSIFQCQILADIISWIIGIEFNLWTLGSFMLIQTHCVGPSKNHNYVEGGWMWIWPEKGQYR